MLSNPNAPTFAFDDLPLYWQMTRCEKFAFAKLLEVAKPETAIEIGTYQGGSLQLIAEASERVYSIDVSPEPKEKLSERFPNVEFMTGESKSLIPTVLQRINDANESLGFVLIDGDHSAEGVRNDINAVLRYKPQSTVYILFHDSFHPPCREGILSADWHDCPWVHFVEVDFVPGVYHAVAFDKAPPRSMFGGLAVAMMRPEPRTSELVVNQSQKGLYDAVWKASCHSDSLPTTLARRVIHRLQKASGR